MERFVEELLNNSDTIGLAFTFLLLIKIFCDIFSYCCCGKEEKKVDISKLELKLLKQNELLEKELIKRESYGNINLIDDLNEIIESDQRCVRKVAMIKQLLLKY